MDQKYLYGASVQGIQDYIFKTNALKEIIGGTEIVQRICTDLFESVLKEAGGTFNDQNCIVRAAGNIRYIFESKDDCQKVFRVFPKTVLGEAPGVTISQAAVPYNGDYAACSQALEKKLRAQRNRPMRSTQQGLMAVKRNQRTGMPALAEEGHPDEGMKQKLAYSDAMSLCQKAFGIEVPAKRFPFNLGDLTDRNDWIAVIHADGNGMGRRFQEAGGQGVNSLKTLSQSIDKHTSEAAQAAYKIIAEKYHFENLDRIPIRPIVLSGDDFSVICRADLALDYVCEFIMAFEQKTKFSACAGIAFVKSSFPFYFSYELAESLCDEAKSEARGNNKSCVLFHKVQDSFYSDFKDIKQRELSPGGYSLCFGPYYIGSDGVNPGRWTVDDLTAAADIVSKKNNLKTIVRKWLSGLSVNPEKAAQWVKRAKMVNSNDENLCRWIDQLTRMTPGPTPAYDVLSLNTVIHQTTKK